MSPEKQRVAIAEACGWKHCMATRENPIVRGGYALPNFFGKEIDAWWHESHPTMKGVYGGPPDYLNNLNSMHDAEMGLTDQEYHAFTIRLSELSWRLYPHQTDDGQYKNRLRASWSATAAQRAEAFLRTIGKWEEAQ